MTARPTHFLLLVVLAILTVGGVRTVHANYSQNIALRPLSLDPKHPGERRLGELIFLKAWELGSDNPDFGGISALAALPDGRFVGVGDAGTLIGFGLSNDERADRPFIAPLPDSQGEGKSFKDRDSEGVAYDPDSRQFWISYENRHAIRRFSPAFARMSGKARPSAMQDWPKNKGAEFIVRLSDGRFVVITENLDDDMHDGLLFSGDPVETGTAISAFRYAPPEGYRVTDGAMLPDGRLLVLQRHIGFPSGFTAKLSIVEVGAIRPEARVTGRVIATLAAPLLVDNMEGVAVTQEEDATVVWLISDDNFTILQRTLLMKFRLAERGTKKKPAADPTPGFLSL